MKLIEKDPATDAAFTDFFWVPRTDTKEAQKYILDLMNGKLKEKRGFDSLKDIQVLSPGKAGDIGVNELNKQIQNLLNPDGKKVSSFMRINDKIVNNKNNQDLNIVNGDIGYIRKVTKEYCREINDHITAYEIQYGEGSGPTGNGYVICDSDALSNTSLAYATTVHKSQGSEYPCIIMPVFCTHYTLLFRNLLYTGMTRAKSLLVMVGEPKALGIALRNNSPSKRVSRLCPILQNAHSYFITA
jgi:exodeoxyribonuclease V alpha subunit